MLNSSLQVERLRLLLVYIFLKSLSFILFQPIIEFSNIKQRKKLSYCTHIVAKSLEKNQIGVGKTASDSTILQQKKFKVKVGVKKK